MNLLEKASAAIETGGLSRDYPVEVRTFLNDKGYGVDVYTNGNKVVFDVNSRVQITHEAELMRLGALFHQHGISSYVIPHVSKRRRAA